MLTYDKKIDKYLTKNNIDRRKFAAKVGVTEVSLSRITQGKRPLPHVIFILKNISDEMGISLDELIEGDIEESIFLMERIHP